MCGFEAWLGTDCFIIYIIDMIRLHNEGFFHLSSHNAPANPSLVDIHGTFTAFIHLTSFSL